MTLNVLSITFDGNLAQPSNKNQLSGAQQRQRDYAQMVDNYIILTRRSKNSATPSVQLSPNLHVYPTKSLIKRNFIKRSLPAWVNPSSTVSNQLSYNSKSASNWTGWLFAKEAARHSAKHTFNG